MFAPRRIALAAALIALTALARPLSADQQRRIATLAPEGSLWMKQMRKGAEAIRKATDGRVDTMYYPGGIQGDEKDVINKMELGSLDGAALTSIGLGLIYPGIRVLQLPGLYETEEEVDYVRQKMWPYFQKQFRKKGYELLTPGDVGWIYLFSLKPIKTREELSRTKIWKWDGDPMSREIFDRLGLRGVALGVPEVLPALHAGKVEAVFGSPLAAVSLQWHDKIRYMSSRPIGYGIGGMVMRKKVWDAASDADRAAQAKIGKQLTRKTIQLVRRDNARALKAMERYGVQVVPTPEKVAADLEAEAKKLWDDWTGKIYTREELEMVLRYRDEFRARKSGSAAN